MNKQLHRSCLAIAGLTLASSFSGCATQVPMLSGGMFSDDALAQRRSSVAQTPIARAQAAKPPTDSGSVTAPKLNGPSQSNIMKAGFVQTQPQQFHEPESFALPREPIGTPPQILTPTPPPVGSPFQLAGHRYRPMYSQMNGSCAPADCEIPCGPECGPECGPNARCVDPQEYIFDGGDRIPQVRIRDDMTQAGLDPEDTVIQYTTANGQTFVQSGCRVAIYAPRFASVRKRTASQSAELALRPQASVLPDGPGIVREQLPPISITKPVAPVAKDSLRIVEAFRDRQRPMPSEMILPMGVISDAFKPFEDLDIIRHGDLLGTDPAKLALAAAAAKVWSNVDAIQVLIDGQAAVVETDLKQTQETVTYEFKGARIRLCKVASEQIASPGDVISFTIRFDNVGDSPLKNLVVTDSLAPRLEYVDASQQSSLPASFATTPNEAGSKVLRWEFENAIKPGEGGIVRFDAKVR